MINTTLHKWAYTQPLYCDCENVYMLAEINLESLCYFEQTYKKRKLKRDWNVTDIQTRITAQITVITVD